MAHSKHENDIELPDMPYEPNALGMKGIIYFGIGLVLLMGVTSALMWVFLGVLKSNNESERVQKNPMMMSEKERLPPEPRLQSAPGFGVETEKGYVNLELTAPQSEYWVLKKEWADRLANGSKDKATGTVVSLPIEQAKERLLEENVKAKAGEQAESDFQNSRKMISDSSAGRMASETRR